MAEMTTGHTHKEAARIFASLVAELDLEPDRQQESVAIETIETALDAIVNNWDDARKVVENELAEANRRIEELEAKES